MKASLITCKFLGRPQKKKGKKKQLYYFYNKFPFQQAIAQTEESIGSTDKLFSPVCKGSNIWFPQGFFSIYSFIRVYYFILLYLVIPQGFYTRCKPIFWKNTAKCTSFFKFFLYHWIIQARNDMGYLWSCFYTFSRAQPIYHEKEWTISTVLQHTFRNELHCSIIMN